MCGLCVGRQRGVGLVSICGIIVTFLDRSWGFACGDVVEVVDQLYFGALCLDVRTSTFFPTNGFF